MLFQPVALCRPWKCSNGDKNFFVGIPAFWQAAWYFFLAVFRWPLKPGLLGLVSWPLAENGWGWCKVTVPHPEEERPFFFWGYLWGSGNCNYSAELLMKVERKPQRKWSPKDSISVLRAACSARGIQAASDVPVVWKLSGFWASGALLQLRGQPQQVHFNIQVHS